MRYLQTFIILSLASLICIGQTPRPLTEKDLLTVEIQVESEAVALKDILIKDEHGSEYLTDLHIEFSIDTFKIEERQRLCLEIDYSTNGMVGSALEASREYDQLLNKYYRRLLSKLSEDDKKILIQSQKNWIQFRDSELEFNEVLTEDKSSGGGTIQRVIAASRILDLTQRRVIELYRYLGRNFE